MIGCGTQLVLMFLLRLAGVQAHASVDAFVGLCPLLFLAADEDVSVDDSVRCAKIAREAVSLLATRFD